MAINPSTLFQNLNGPDTEYPYGSAKNSSGVGLKDGTEIKAQVFNDIWGFLQRVLDEAGVVPSGNPDTVLVSQYYDALMGLVQNANASFLPIDLSVGTDGDYATINDALEYLSKFRPGYSTTENRATVTLLTGFVMAEQIICDGIDLSWITITSIAPVVSVTETAITQVVGTDDYGFSVTPVIAAIKGGKSPYLDVVFRYDTRLTDGRTGLFAAGAGSVINGKGTGCQNAFKYGCFALNGGRISAYSLSNYEAKLYGTYAKGAGSTIASGGIDNHGCMSSGCVSEDNGLISSVGVGLSINNDGCKDHGCLVSGGGVISSEWYIYNTGCFRGAQASSGGKITTKGTMNNTGCWDMGAMAKTGGVIIAVTMNNREDDVNSMTDTMVFTGGMIIRFAGSGGVSQDAGIMTAEGYINV